MGRRKNDENPVSLFAFQDIITSITGIMVLVVLLIILDIIKHEDVKPTKTPSPFKEDITKLEEMQQELQEKLDKDKEWLTKNEEFIVKALSVDLASLPDLIEKERKNNLKLQAGITNVEKENIRLESLVLKTKDDIQKNKTEIEDKKDKIVAVKEKIKINDPKLQELDKKIQELKNEEQKRKNYVEIRTSDELKQSPVFVECSQNMIKTKVIKTAKLEEIKNDNQDPKQLLGAFYNWLKKNRNPEKECIVLIVKPSAAEFASMLITLLKQEGYSYNMEPMQENKTGVYE